MVRGGGEQRGWMGRRKADGRHASVYPHASDTHLLIHTNLLAAASLFRGWVWPSHSR